MGGGTIARASGLLHGLLGYCTGFWTIARASGLLHGLLGIICLKNRALKLYCRSMVYNDVGRGVSAAPFSIQNACRKEFRRE